MKILMNSESLAEIIHEYNLVYTFPGGKDLNGDHVKIAEELALRGDKIKLYMVIIESERLADEHWDDPEYLQRTNYIGACDALVEARKELTNKYYDQKQLSELMEKHNLHTWKYNYQEQPEKERKFIFEVEDVLFNYQILRKKLEIIEGYLKSAECKLDEEGYLIEDDNGDTIIEDDPKAVAAQKERLLEGLLMPKVLTEYKRVYAMPHPFNHWDERSFWHQFFFIEDTEHQETFYARGQGGSSGCREQNGRWAHVFAWLANHYGMEATTWHLTYNPHNQLVFNASYEAFRCLQYDLSGNYHVPSYQSVDELFAGKIIEPLRKFRGWEEIETV